MPLATQKRSQIRQVAEAEAQRCGDWLEWSAVVIARNHCRVHRVIEGLQLPRRALGIGQREMCEK